MASKENLLELSAIISRNWLTVVDEDGSYIWIYPDSKTICGCLQVFHSRRFASAKFFIPRVGLNILLLDDASGIDMQPLMPSTKIYSGSWDRTCNAREWFPLPQQLRGVRCAWKR
jgi:hypothetical protein